MFKEKMMFLVPGVMLGLSAAAAAPAASADKPQSYISRRDALESYRFDIEVADKLIDNGNYKFAIARLVKTIDLLKKVDKGVGFDSEFKQLEKRIVHCYNKIIDAHAARAVENNDTKQLDAAINVCQEVSLLYSNYEKEFGKKAAALENLRSKISKTFQENLQTQKRRNVTVALDDAEKLLAGNSVAAARNVLNSIDVKLATPGEKARLEQLKKRAAAAAGTLRVEDNTVTRVHIGRQEIMRSCDVMANRANKFMNKGDYRNAISEYLKIKKTIQDNKAVVGNAELFARKLEFCTQQIKNCYMLMAEAAMAKADSSAMYGDFELAIKLCKEAIEQCPEKKIELEDRIAFYTKRQNAAFDREAQSIKNLAPGIDSQKYQIEILLEQGRDLMKRNELALARSKFEEILLIDPYNAAGAQALRAINTRIRKAATLRQASTARHMTGQVIWDGAIPIVQTNGTEVAVNQLNGAPVKKIADVAESELEKKLKETKIEPFSFEEGFTFRQMMDEISSKCESAKINFLIKDAKRGEDEKGPELKVFSFSQPTSVYDVLTSLRRIGNLDFRIAGKAVLVAAPGVRLENLEVSFFPVTIPKSLNEKSLRDMVAAQAAIDFPQDTYLKISGNHVVACHTPDNLKRIQAALAKISEQEEYMVQVMFKFIEVGQKDLDELAFNWQYARSGRYSTGEIGNSLLRHYSVTEGDAFSGSSATGSTEDANVNITWSDAKNSLKFSIYALDWADNSNVLYSPRVTTISGHTASIDMSEKRYYPDDFEDIDTESNENFRIEVTSPQPNLDDEQKLGVHFSITPEVSVETANGKQYATITVPVHIPIKQFFDWLIVDTRTKSGDDTEGEYIKKPIFTNREIKTTVKLFDGETVLIASIANDVIKTIHDKVPILGDIPLIGRLFQSKYTNSQKIHLMVFMTCRVVRPDGSARFRYDDDEAANPDSARDGLPKFSRNY